MFFKNSDFINADLSKISAIFLRFSSALSAQGKCILDFYDDYDEKPDVRRAKKFFP